MCVSRLSGHLCISQQSVLFSLCSQLHSAFCMHATYRLSARRRARDGLLRVPLQTEFGSWGPLTATFRGASFVPSLPSRRSAPGPLFLREKLRKNHKGSEREGDELGETLLACLMVEERALVSVSGFSHSGSQVIKGLEKDK